MNLTLIRHTSVAVESGICYGQSDVDVSPTFEAEAQIVLSKLQELTFDAVYCSPLMRCRKLASYCGYPKPIIDDRLMELNFGDWEMKAWKEIQDPRLQLWFNNWYEESPTQGESFKIMTNRVENFLNEIKNHPYQQVIIFTHAGVIRSAGIINKQFSATEAFEYKVEYGECHTFIL
ncbi:MAG TPA: alpha-ribazole phosphatase [Paludibacter sp.]|nr:alpha-ribazole phosphatase [Paludibacter sp.]